MSSINEKERHKILFIPFSTPKKHTSVQVTLFSSGFMVTSKKPNKNKCISVASTSGRLQTKIPFTFLTQFYGFFFCMHPGFCHSTTHPWRRHTEIKAPIGVLLKPDL